MGSATLYGVLVNVEEGNIDLRKTFPFLYFFERVLVLYG